MFGPESFGFKRLESDWNLMSQNPGVQPRKPKQPQEEPTFSVDGTTPSPALAPPIPTPQVVSPTQGPQLSPLARKNIVKVDPNLVRQAIREKLVIPARQVPDENVVRLATDSEIIQNYLRYLTKDLMGGSFQFYGTPQNMDEFFEDALIVLGDRIGALARTVMEKRLAEIQALVKSDQNYSDIAKKVGEVHNQMILLLSAFERAILEIAGLATSKMRIEGLSPLEVAQTLGITPVSTDRI